MCKLMRNNERMIEAGHGCSDGSHFIIFFSFAVRYNTNVIVFFVLFCLFRSIFFVISLILNPVVLFCVVLLNQLKVVNKECV